MFCSSQTINNERLWEMLFLLVFRTTDILSMLITQYFIINNLLIQKMKCFYNPDFIRISRRLQLIYLAKKVGYYKEFFYFCARYYFEFFKSKINVNARVAELVDALDSKSSGSNTVRVRFPPRARFKALFLKSMRRSAFLFDW